MNKLFHGTRSHRFTPFSGLCFLLLCAISTVQAAGPGTPPLVVLPNGPILRSPSHPNTILDLSVEFPTAGAAYRSDYSYQRAYPGYFDATQCYSYTLAATHTGAGKYDDSQDDSRYFKPAGRADKKHNCAGGAFSGNFMNWAASSAIDMMRVGLTGGDRYIDEVGKTVLQRAVLPGFFYADNYRFPTKVLATDANVSPAQVGPFATNKLYIMSCKNRVVFTNAVPKFRDGSPAFPLDSNYAECDTNNAEKNLGEFVVRVEVCSNTEGPLRPDLCKRYGQNYKPEGEIQGNADNMRFAAMGYLLNDPTNQTTDTLHYGGVLRAAMKYVGPLQYDVALTPSDNPKKEWSPTTGIFVIDPSPDGSPTTAYSGVINYLNRFGRSGNYKTWDPVSELYYESLRYLQGLSPTPAATAGMTVARKEGFPVITNWTTNDPIQESCQKNTIILIADPNTNYDFEVPGNTRVIKNEVPVVADGIRPAFGATGIASALDVMSWTDKIGVIENTTHGPDATIRPNLSNLSAQSNGYWAPNPKDVPPLIMPLNDRLKGSYYIAGLAYWANVNSLRVPTSPKNEIYARTLVIDVDEGGNGKTDSTSSRTSPLKTPRESQLYLAAKYGGFTPALNAQNKPNPDPYLTPTPTPVLSTSGCYQYLWDLNGNCDPDNYFLASDGADFVSAVHKAFNLAGPVGEVISSVGASRDYAFEGQNGFIYQGSTLPSYAGDVRRSQFTYSPSTGLTIADPDINTPTRKIKESLADPRNIYTYHGGVNPANSTTPFKWSTLDQDQRDSLDGADGLGQGRLEFLRGITSDEYSASNPTGHFRQRPKSVEGNTNLIGDIVHSNPTIVSGPKKNIAGAAYQAFLTAHSGRKTAVYVGANDGMLHAFRTDLGAEYFAYIPKMIFPKLNALTTRNYNHKSYVDGGIVAAEAKVGSNWKTVLASTMGDGAQGIFALDISDPEHFNADHGALWEFSDADDPDIGNIFSPPLIAKFLKSTSSQGVPIYEYFVVVASGVNNYRDDGNSTMDNPPTASPGGALFLLSLNKTSADNWIRNQNYFKFPIPNSAIVSTKQSGLSAPALVTGGDDAVRIAYAGDLQGNLWKFDFTAHTALNLASARSIFQARDSNNNLQPITTPPKVVFAPQGGYVVLFGTGKFLENSDIRTHAQQSFYGIFDSLAPTYSVANRTVLEKRTLTGTPTSTKLQLTGNNFSYFGSASKNGWYLDFPDTQVSGERIIAPPILSYGKIFFNSLLPANTACEKNNSGRTYALNALTGLAEDGPGNETGALSTVGALSSPIAFDTQALSPGASPIPDAIGKKVVRRTFSTANFGTKGVVGKKVGQGYQQNYAVDITTGVKY